MSDISGGKFEVPQDSFDDIVAEKSAAALSLDLKELMPDLFVGTDRMPRLLAKAWRAAADEVMEQTKGVYTFRGGTVIGVMFDGVPDSMAKSRLMHLRARILDHMRQLQAAANAAAPAEEKKQKPRDISMKGLMGQMETALQKLTREGLGENPGDEMVRLWAARTMHNILHTPLKVPLLPEMVELVQQSDIVYAPYIDRETDMIAGSIAVIRSAIPAASYNTGETMRQDMAVLFSAVVQMYYLRSRALEGNVILPVRAATLADETLADLYRSYLPLLAADVSGSIMLEVLGLPEDRVMPQLANTIDALSNTVRCCMVGTSVLTRRNRLDQFPVLHACGFSAAEKGVDIAAQGKIYAMYYRNIGVRTYIKDVNDAGTMAFARETGFTYISGAAAGPLQKSAASLQKTGIG